MIVNFLAILSDESAILKMLPLFQKFQSRFDFLGNRLFELFQKAREFMQTSSVDIKFDSFFANKFISQIKDIFWLKLSGKELKLIDNCKDVFSKTFDGASTADKNLLNFWNGLNKNIENLPSFPNSIEGVADIRKWLANPQNTNNIISLDLTDCRLTNIPPEISCFKNLQSLNLSSGISAPLDYNQISVLPKEIFELKKLRVLDISDNKITNLPAKIRKLKNLEFLNIGFNKINTLPPEIGDLDKLQVLILYENKLSELPQEISKLNNLKWFFLGRNNFMNFPKQIESLKSLELIEMAPPTLLEPTTKANEILKEANNIANKMKLEVFLVKNYEVILLKSHLNKIAQDMLEKLVKIFEMSKIKISG